MLGHHRPDHDAADIGMALKQGRQLGWNIWAIGAVTPSAGALIGAPPFSPMVEAFLWRSERQPVLDGTDRVTVLRNLHTVPVSARYSTNCGLCVATKSL